MSGCRFATMFTVIETLEQLNWTWPKKIHHAPVQNRFRLSFLKDKANLHFISQANIEVAFLESKRQMKAGLNSDINPPAMLENLS